MRDGMCGMLCAVRGSVLYSATLSMEKVRKAAAEGSMRCSGGT